MKKLRMTVSFLICFTAFICIFFLSDTVTTGLKSGLILCSSVIIPSLFPFMTVCTFAEKSALLSACSGACECISSKLFGLPGCAFPAIIISFFAGYPVGARLAKSMHASGDISVSQGKKMCLFSIGAGPAFLVIAVGCGMLQNKSAGWILAAAHILSSVIIALVCGKVIKCDDYRPDKKAKAPRAAISDAFVESVASSSGAMLSICAYTILFSGIVAIIRESSQGVFSAVLTSIMEVSNGCACAAAMSFPLPFISAVTGFGGISVLCQIMSCAGKCRPNFRLLILIRLLHALISYVICSLLIKIFPYASYAFSNFSAAAPRLSQVSVGFALALMILCIVFLFSTYQKSDKRLVDFF